MALPRKPRGSTPLQMTSKGEGVGLSCGLGEPCLESSLGPSVVGSSSSSQGMMGTPYNLSPTSFLIGTGLWLGRTILLVEFSITLLSKCNPNSSTF